VRWEEIHREYLERFYNNNTNACLLKNSNKIPIPILLLCKAIPCSSNSAPILDFLKYFNQYFQEYLFQGGIIHFTDDR
jgi:hypothetical protein